MNLKDLTGPELDRAYEAADYLCKMLNFDHVDPTYIKLDTLRCDLVAAREDKQKLDLPHRRQQKQQKKQKQKM